MGSVWSDRDAKLAQALAEAKAKIGPCPNCGADPDIDMIDVSTSGQNHGFIPGEVTCSARCYETDPEAYLLAIKARQSDSSSRLAGIDSPFERD